MNDEQIELGRITIRLVFDGEAETGSTVEVEYSDGLPTGDAHRMLSVATMDLYAMEMGLRD